MKLEQMAKLLPDLIEPCVHCTKLRIQLQDFKVAAAKAAGFQTASAHILGKLHCECHMCDNSGFVISEKGKTLLAFFERFRKPEPCTNERHYEPEHEYPEEELAP